jgi:hypothetical protein
MHSPATVITASIRNASPESRWWVLVHVMLAACVVPVAMFHLQPDWISGLFVGAAGGGLLGLSYACRCPRRLSWYFTSERWVWIPVLAFCLSLLPACITWWKWLGQPFIFDRAPWEPIPRHPSISAVLLLLKVALGAWILSVILPRAATSEAGGDWTSFVATDAVRSSIRVWLPGGLLCGLALADAALDWQVVFYGMVNPLTVVFLAHTLWVWERRGVLRHPRLAVLGCLCVSLLFLYPRPVRLFYGDSQMLYWWTGWLLPFPALLEVFRNPDILYMFLPSTSLEELNGWNYIVSPLFSELVSKSTAGGFAAAAVLPFLLALYLAVCMRNRWSRGAGVALLSVMVFICATCNITDISPKGEPARPLLHWWPAGAIKGAVMACVLAWIITATRLTHQTSDSALPSTLRRWFRCLVIPAFVSAGVSVLAAAAVFYPSSDDPLFQQEASPSTVKILHLVDSLPGEDFKSEFYTTIDLSYRTLEPIHTFPVNPFFVLPDSVQSCQTLLAEFDLERRVIEQLRGYFGPIAPVRSEEQFYKVRRIVGVCHLQCLTAAEDLSDTSTLASPHLVDHVDAALDVLATTLQIADLLKGSGMSYLSRRIPFERGVIVLASRLLPAIQQVSPSSRRKHLLEKMLGAMSKVSGLDWTIATHEELLQRLWPRGSFLYRWPNWMLLPYFWNQVHSIQFYRWAFWGRMVDYLWLRAQLRTLLFRERMGRFPSTCEEVDSTLGMDMLDGYIYLLDGRFASFLRLASPSENQLELSVDLRSCSSAPQNIHLQAYPLTVVLREKPGSLEENQ